LEKKRKKLGCLGVYKGGREFFFLFFFSFDDTLPLVKGFGEDLPFLLVVSVGHNGATRVATGETPTETAQVFAVRLLGGWGGAGLVAVVAPGGGRVPGELGG